MVEILLTVNVFVVFAMGVPAELKLFTDDSHRTTLPVWPFKVSTVLLVPAQTVVLPATVPPTVVRLTVIVAEALGADGQTPLCTTAR